MPFFSRKTIHAALALTGPQYVLRQKLEQDEDRQSRPASPVRATSAAEVLQIAPPAAVEMGSFCPRDLQPLIGDGYSGVVDSISFASKLSRRRGGEDDWKHHWLGGERGEMAPLCLRVAHTDFWDGHVSCSVCKTWIGATRKMYSSQGLLHPVGVVYSTALSTPQPYLQTRRYLEKSPSQSVAKQNRLPQRTVLARVKWHRATRGNVVSAT